MSAAEWLTRNGRYVAAGFLVLGLAVRLRRFVAAPSYWGDEAYVLVNVFDKSFLELAGPLRCDQAAPLLFLWSLRALYETIGGSEWAMRLPAFLASIISMPLMIPLARRFAGSPGWIWAVALVAVSQTAAFLTINAKPYASDLLAVELAFLAAVAWITHASPTRLIALFAVSLLLPWMSYPSVFALSGVSLALAIDALRRRSAWRGCLCAAVSVTWALSFGAMWFFVARHQPTHSLSEYWQRYFFDVSSIPAALEWLGTLALRIGNYPTTGMGAPLLILAAIGAIRLARQARELLCLPLGTGAAALAANAFRLYPLEDRLLFFAAPGLWLLAAAGVSSILRPLPRCHGWVAAAIFSLILVPGVVRYCYWVAVVPSKVEFRDAFEFVDEHRKEGDVWWVSDAEVFEVYRGKKNFCLSGPLTAERVNELCCGRRVWMIIPPRVTEPAPFRELGFDEVDRKQFATLNVVLFAPASP